jgi:hypothetical protein
MIDGERRRFSASDREAFCSAAVLRRFRAQDRPANHLPTSIGARLPKRRSSARTTKAFGHCASPPVYKFEHSHPKKLASLLKTF